MIRYKIHNVVEIPYQSQFLTGELNIPEEAKGVVIFSHGSSISRFSPANKIISHQLEENNFGTFLLDIMSDKEEEDPENKLNTIMLSERLIAATRWIMDEPVAAGLPLGYFGTGTGAAYAFLASIKLESIKAMVTANGRTDLVSNQLNKIPVPVRLIVSAQEKQLIEQYKKDLPLFKEKAELKIMEDPGNIFGEKNIYKASRQISEWFENYFIHF